MKHRVYCCC